MDYAGIYAVSSWNKLGELGANVLGICLDNLHGVDIF